MNKKDNTEKVYVYKNHTLYIPGIPQRDIEPDEWAKLDVSEETKQAALKSGIYELKEVKNGIEKQ